LKNLLDDLIYILTVFGICPERTLNVKLVNDLVAFVGDAIDQLINGLSNV